MYTERTKTTEAFQKYIDEIFILQNDLMNLAPKKFCERFDSYEYSLETYNDELWLRAGMCVKLAKKIQKYLSFKNTLNLYTEKMLKLASNQDLDYIEIKNKTKKLDETLFSHAKLEFCFENFLKEINLKNDISVLACLMEMYAKVVSLKKSQNPNEKLEGITLSKWYRYVRFAMLEEEAVDIKDLKNLSLQEFSEKLFDLYVDMEYFHLNTTKETSISTDSETIYMDVYVIEENNDFEDFRIEFEQQVNDWLVKKIYSDCKKI